MTTNARLDNPRRAMPTLRIFHDFEMIVEREVYRDDARSLLAHVTAHLDEIDAAAYPAATARRIINEAP